MTRVFLSYAFPPAAYPRAVQVSRLVKYLDGPPIEVLCADDGAGAEALSRGLDGAAAVRRLPWTPAARAARMIHAGLRHRLEVPDAFRPWARVAAAELLRRPWEAGDVLVTFGQPMSDHLAGLRVARRAGVPWVAHFSDPWADSPFEHPAVLWDRRSARMERAVIEAAARVVFTSAETADLVMAKYPAPWRGTARVVPHAFDPEVLDAVAPATEPEGLAIRYVGNFYGHRTPAAFARALARVHRESPHLLDGARVELIGSSEREGAVHDAVRALPDGLLAMVGRVDYARSLELIHGADLLLTLDAPAEKSVFLPSKLIEYVGAARPILAVTPPGTAADLVRRVGGWVADPADEDAVAAALRDALMAIRAAPRAEPWGDPAVRDAYRAPAVARQFDAVLRELEPAP